MSYSKRNRLIICLYFVASVIAVLLVVPLRNVGHMLFALGGSSGFIAFGAFCSSSVDVCWSVLALIWMIGFPTALVVSFIVALKKSYIPFCVTVVLDVIVVYIWVIHLLVSKNIYSLGIFAPDAIVSTIYVILLIGSLCKTV